MFEDSTFESTGKIRTRSRGWMMATFALNSVILLAMVLAPLIHMHALPARDTAFLVAAPPPASAPPTPTPRLERTGSNSQAPQLDLFSAPTVMPTNIAPDSGPAPSSITTSIAMDTGSGIIPGGIGDTHQTPPPRVVHPAPAAPVRVPSSLAAGMLIQQVMPQYPALARTMRLGGTVVLAATIGKDGRIANLHVVSGPAILQQAALEAVSQWRYRPYLLNGEPVEVETSVNVVFTVGN